MSFPRSRRQHLTAGLAAVAAVLSACLAIGCAGEDPAESAADGTDEAAARTLTIYSMRSQKLVAPAIRAFRAAHPEITVNARWGGAELANAVIEEGNESMADVFLAEDASTLGVLEGRSLFAELPAELIDGVPRGFSSAARRWVGTTGRARAIAYNPSRVRPDQLPTTIEGFADEEWRGRVGWAPESPSFPAFIAAMIQMRGREHTAQWLRAMRANEPHDYPSNTPAVMAVSRGEVDVALTIHHYLYRLREEMGEDFPVANHYLRNESAGSMVNMSGAGIMQSAPNPAAARLFIAFLLSAEGQTLFVLGNHEFPAVPTVPSPDGLPRIDRLGAPRLNLAQLSDLQATQTLLRETGVRP